MELYKLENGRLKKFNGGFVVYNNRIYTNPKEEVIRLAGYKDVIKDEEPEYNIETQYLNTIYTEYEDYIAISYEICDIIEEEIKSEVE